MKRTMPFLSKVANRIKSVFKKNEKPKSYLERMGGFRKTWRGLGPRCKQLFTIHRHINRSKYTPHQGARECARRRGELYAKPQSIL